jgi:hypothetical protein
MKPANHPTTGLPWCRLVDMRERLDVVLDARFFQPARRLAGAREAGRCTSNS